MHHIDRYVLHWIPNPVLKPTKYTQAIFKTDLLYGLPGWLAGRPAGRPPARPPACLPACLSAYLQPACRATFVLFFILTNTYILCFTFNYKFAFFFMKWNHTKALISVLEHFPEEHKKHLYVWVDSS